MASVVFDLEVEVFTVTPGEYEFYNLDASVDLRGALAADPALGMFLRRFWLSGGPYDCEVDTATTADGIAGEAGPQFTPAWLEADRAIQLVHGEHAVDVPGPNHPSNQFRDAVEPLRFRPAAAVVADLNAFGEAIGEGAGVLLRLTFEDEPAAIAPVLPPVPAVEAVVGVAGSVVLPVAIAGSPDPVYEILEAPLPAGFAFDADPDARRLSWTEGTAAGVSMLTYRATNDSGMADEVFEVRVLTQAVPVLPIVGNVTGTIGTAGAAMLPAPTAGRPAPELSIVEPLPQGVIFEAVLRLVQWSGDTIVGNYALTYRAENLAGRTDRPFVLTIEAVPPALPAIAAVTVIQGAGGFVVLPAATAGLPAPAYLILEDLPAGFALESGRRLTWTADTIVGAYALTFLARNVGGTAAQPFAVNVLAAPVAPVLPVVTAVTAVVGVAGSRTLPAAIFGMPAPDYSIVEALPAGFAFDGADRDLTWTEGTVPGVYMLTYRARNSAGRADRTLTITVLAEAPPLTVAPMRDLFWIRGAAVDVQLPAAIGGTPPITYAVDPDPVAEGIAFAAADRRFAGVPAATQDPVAVVVTVTDAAGVERRLLFGVRVGAEGVPVFLPPMPDQTFAVGVAINRILPAATEGTPPFRYELVRADGGADPLGPGVQFFGRARRLYGAPRETVAARALRYLATGADGLVMEEPFDAEVVAAPVPITFAAFPDRQWYVGNDVDVVLPEVLTGAGPVGYELVAPDLHGLEFEPETRRVYGQPLEEAAAVQWTLRATGNDGERGTLSFGVTIGPAVPDPLIMPAIPDQDWEVDSEVDVRLPAPIVGGGALELSPAPPRGVVFDAALRRMRGRPAEVQAPRLYRLRAVGGGLSRGGASFSIRVRRQLEPRSRIRRLRQGGVPAVTILDTRKAIFFPPLGQAPSWAFWSGEGVWTTGSSRFLPGTLIGVDPLRSRGSGLGVRFAPEGLFRGWLLSNPPGRRQAIVYWLRLTEAGRWVAARTLPGTFGRATGTRDGEVSINFERRVSVWRGTFGGELLSDETQRLRDPADEFCANLTTIEAGIDATWPGAAEEA